MQLKIYSPDGLKSSEVKAITRLQNEFRDAWHGFASFLVNDGQGSMEIDLLLVTHDRFILCEIKEWSGNITSNGRQWTQCFPGGRSKTHPSPVHIKRQQAQRLISLFDSELKSLWGCYYVVEHVIIMAGTATIGDLPKNEQEVVFTLDEFLKIGNSADAYNRILPSRNMDIFKPGGIKRPNEESQLKIFRRWFESDSAIKPRQRLAAGYLVPKTDEALFRHPKNFYQEFTGSHNESQKLKALLRCWDFCQLGPIAMTQESRSAIALRERRVIEFVASEAPQIKKDYLMQPQHSATEGEIEEDFVEVYEHTPLLTRLDMHIMKLISLEDKLKCIRNVLTPFVELHKLGIAHRDISVERLWHDSHSGAIILSGLITAKFPEIASKQSISDIREQLSSNYIPIPEEKFAEEVDSMRLDVYLLGAVVFQIAFNEQLSKDEYSLIWVEPKNDPYDGKLTTWIKKSIELEARNRYSSAQEMLEEFSKITSPHNKCEHGDEQSIMREVGEYHKNDLIPFVVWPPNSSIDNKEGRQAFRSLTDGGEASIKLWPTLMPVPGDYAKNRKIYEFIKRCQAVQRSQLNIPTIFDFGISANGLYIVQKYVVGKTLEDEIEHGIGRDEAGLTTRLSVANKLISSVKLLHDSELTHGDLKPENILVTYADDVPSLVFLDFFDLDQHGNRPYNTEYAPKIQQGAKSRDIYATYCIVDEIFSRCGGYAKTIRAEIARALGDDSQAVPISLTPLQETIDSATNVPHEDIENIIFYEEGTIDSQVQLDSYAGEFYVTLNDRNLPTVKVYITGAQQKMTIHAKTHEGILKISKTFLNPVFPADIIREARNRFAKKIRCNLLVNKGNGDNSFFWQKIFSLFDQDKSVAQENIRGLKQPVAEFSKLELPELWETILKTEFEQYAQVIAAEDGTKSSNGVLVEIEGSISEFGFDFSDNIEVTDGDPDHPWIFGELELQRSQPDTLFIKRPSNKKIRKGDTLQLREQRSAVSWRRRRDALERILRNEALIPNLFSMFSPRIEPGRQTLISLPEPNQELWAIYEKILDPSKINAFKHVLSGQLNVIMGPPGTGKTTLLSVLLDYFSRINEISRVLLVSQSHIAVNEVATRTRKIMDEIGGRLGAEHRSAKLEMVRLGDRDKVNDALLDMHVDALQGQYRTAFLSDLEDRIAALSERLMLPHDFVVQAASLYRSVGNEIKTYYQLKNLPQNPDISSQEYKLRETRIYSALFNKFSEYTDSPDSIFIARDMQKAILECLATRNGINNPRQISKLNDVLNIAHQWYQRLSADSDGFAGFMARTRRLVVGTLVGIGKAAYDIASHQYDVAIVDEAGRASASELAMAMQSAHRVILVGDHRQLPPHYEKEVVEHVARKLNIEPSEVIKTDFERAYKYNDGLMLDTQYRMQEPIGALISQVFYDGKLKTGTTREPGVGSVLQPWNTAVCWMDTSSLDISESRLGTSAANEAEVDIICDQLKLLVDGVESLRKLREWAGKDAHSPIGIITGYSQQVKRLKTRLENDSWATPIREMVKIDTIDSYQGGENRIVILSLVRHNIERKSGFMNDEARINVALSRAKNNLMIVGAAQMWSSLETPLGKVFKFIKDNSLCNCTDYQVISVSKQISE